MRMHHLLTLPCTAALLLSPASSLAASVHARVTINAVDKATGAPHVNASYGSIQFYAENESGETFEPDENGVFIFTKAGRYRIGGHSMYNFCYSSSTFVDITPETGELTVRLDISCE